MYKYTIHFIFVFGLAGYELIASLTSFFGVETTTYSLIIRTIVAILAFIIICYKIGNLKSKRMILLHTLLAMWFIYVLNIVYASLISYDKLSHPIWYYWVWTFGACILPMLSLALSNFSVKNTNSLFYSLYIAVSIAAMLSIIGGSQLLIDDLNNEVESGRLQLQSLNPISYGQLGCSLFILSVWGLIFNNSGKGYYKTCYLLGVLAGVYMVLGSNSRGAIVSVVSCMVFMVMTISNKAKIYALFVMITSGILFIPVTKYLEIEYGYSTYSRLFEQSQLTEVNTLSRIEIFSNAIEQFISNPLFGGALEETTTGSYPHNILIEAFMSMGIIGGSLFLIGMIGIFYLAVYIMRKMVNLGWCSILFIQYFTANQFSGSLYQSGNLWVTVGIVICIYAGMKREKFFNSSNAIKNIMGRE